MVIQLTNRTKKPRIPFNSYRHIDKYDKKIVESSIDSYDDQMASYLKDIGRYDKEKNWSSQTSGYYKLNYYPKVKAIMERQGFTNK